MKIHPFVQANSYLLDLQTLYSIFRLNGFQLIMLSAALSTKWSICSSDFDLLSFCPAPSHCYWFFRSLFFAIKPLPLSIIPSATCSIWMVFTLFLPSKKCHVFPRCCWCLFDYFVYGKILTWLNAPTNTLKHTYSSHIHFQLNCFFFSFSPLFVRCVRFIASLISSTSFCYFLNSSPFACSLHLMNTKNVRSVYNVVNMRLFICYVHHCHSMSLSLFIYDKIYLSPGQYGRNKSEKLFTESNQFTQKINLFTISKCVF